jgi:hypothetical protein
MRVPCFFHQAGPEPGAPPGMSALETLDRARGVPVYRIETAKDEPRLPMYCASGVNPDACRSISIAVWKDVARLREGTYSGDGASEE